MTEAPSALPDAPIGVFDSGLGGLTVVREILRHLPRERVVYVGDTEEEGKRVGSKLLWFLNTSLKSAPQHSRFMPGTAPPEAAPQIYRDAPRPPNGADGGGPNLTNAEKGVAP